MTVLYEDNHLLLVSKAPGEIVQGDKTGDTTLADTARAYIKEKYHKPGEVFLGLPHRLDRPVGGVVVLARTSKALTRMTTLFRDGKVRKTYYAVVARMDGEADAQWHTLEHYLTRNERQNKSYAHATERPGSKRAVLDYRRVADGERYSLLEIRLHTGRHHQIRCQLAAIGHPIKGDLKYGAPRSNPDGSISLHARSVSFEHPVSHVQVDVSAPWPQAEPWPSLVGALAGVSPSE
ncbi:MAG: RluA family pseudouridine synthase [Bacteroidaceae bacterium]|nr:RluA family pseudouridine synthase [Bacteroidaceae bacterium]